MGRFKVQRMSGTRKHGYWKSLTHTYIATVLCACQKGGVGLLLSNRNTEDSPAICSVCGTKYWVEGYQEGIIMGED